MPLTLRLPGVRLSALPPWARMPAHPTAETLQSVRHSYLIYQEMNLLYNLTVGLLVLLTFCETPLWCLHTGTTASRPWLFLPAEVTCPAPDGGFIFLAQIPYVPVAWGCVMELLCYGVLWLWFGFGYELRRR